MQFAGRRNDKRPFSLKLWFGFGAMALASLGMINEAAARGRTGTVSIDCDAGESIQTELVKGFDGMQFDISGVCNESIIVRLDDILIRGATADAQIASTRIAHKMRAPAAGERGASSIGGNSGAGATIFADSPPLGRVSDRNATLTIN